MPRLDNLDELRAFAQVVESGSIVKAAAALATHPSTVSRRLLALEDRIGRPLLNRSTRRQSLSETGRALLGQVHRILLETETAELLLEEDATGLSGLVKIGVVSVLAEDVLVAVSPLMRSNPKLRVQVRVSDQVRNPLTAGLDVVIIGGALADSTLIARKLSDIEIVLAASESYLAVNGAPEVPSDLQHHQAILRPSEPQQTSWTLEGPDGTSHVVTARGQVEVDGARPMVDALRHGLGIGNTSPRMIRRHPCLRRVLPDYRLGSFPLYAIYPSSGQRSAKLQAVVNALHESLERGEL